MSNDCPVCGYDLQEPVRDSLICRCCGTQFGYHDSVRSPAELRAHWLAEGANWHSRRVLPPAEWSARTQLEQAGLMSEELMPEEKFVRV
jgi:hypothetical protein